MRKEGPNVELMRFCPRCGKGAINFSDLEGGSASCLSCNWSGDRNALLLLPLQFNTDKLEDIVAQSRIDFIRATGGSLGEAFGKWLVKYGFVDTSDPHFKKDMELYLKGAVKAAYASILVTRVEIEKSRKQGEMA